MPGAPAAIAAPRAPPETSRCLAPSIPGSPRRLAGSSRPPPSRAGGLPVNGDAARRSPLDRAPARRWLGRITLRRDHQKQDTDRQGVSFRPVSAAVSPCLSGYPSADPLAPAPRTFGGDAFVRALGTRTRAGLFVSTSIHPPPKASGFW